LLVGFVRTFTSQIGGIAPNLSVWRSVFGFRLPGPKGSVKKTEIAHDDGNVCL
jgi:hypothetical protein